MKRTLFLLLSLLPAVQAWGGIEIYVKGHKYDSMEAYQASKRPVVAAVTTAVPVPLNNQQEDYIRQEAQRMGFKVDLSKIKTFQVGKQDPKALHQLYVMSVERGMAYALTDFYQSRGQFDFHIPRQIASSQLQGAIQQAVTNSPSPKLLIAEPGKIRIMALTADNIQSSKDSQ